MQEDDEAISHFEKALAKSEETNTFFERSLYRLAWSYYRLDDFDKALSYMMDILDLSERLQRDTGASASTAPEAIKYAARSFADMADTNDEISPVDAVENFFLKLGEREYEDKIYKKLASELIELQRYEEAILIYQYIQDRWPDDPDNPTFQMEIKKEDFESQKRPGKNNFSLLPTGEWTWICPRPCTTTHCRRRRSH